jgi:hypothetical protein
MTDDGRIHLSVAFAAGEGPRVIQGYSPVAPVAFANVGSVGPVHWDASTRLFSVTVSAGPNQAASIEIRRGHPRSHFDMVR